MPQGLGRCVACRGDGDCHSAFETCQAGKCTFVGCQTHAECRAVLGLENATGAGVRAECR